MSSAVLSLYDVQTSVPFTVASLPDIGLLGSLGLRVGTRIKVENRYALGGPVLLKVEDAFAVAIGKDIATQISVCETARG
ncbi:MAG: ferrous iron transport protein A [Oscillospiraceae bacterium]|nr:ferrous iron transport protein A [Oscillospiraceae bacterium]